MYVCLSPEKGENTRGTPNIKIMKRCRISISSILIYTSCHPDIGEVAVDFLVKMFENIRNTKAYKTNMTEKNYSRSIVTIITIIYNSRTICKFVFYQEVEYY